MRNLFAVLFIALALVAGAALTAPAQADGGVVVLQATADGVVGTEDAAYEVLGYTLLCSNTPCSVAMVNGDAAADATSLTGGHWFATAATVSPVVILPVPAIMRSGMYANLLTNATAISVFAKRIKE